MKILIVDDEPLVRKSLGRACRAKGHEVTEAADGSEGLQMWTNSAPDVAFVDVLMPGLSGPELIRAVAQATDSARSANSNEAKKTRIILMSAYSGEHNVSTAQELGADLFIPKPFDDVFAVVAKAEELFGGSKR